MSQITSSYAALWRRTPRDLGFLLASLPVVVAGASVMITGVALGLGLVIVWVGVPIVIASLIVGRWLGTLELSRLRATGHDIDRPDWSAHSPAAGAWGRVRRYVADKRYWNYLLHSSVVNLAVGIISWTVAVSWVAIGLGGVTYALWAQFGEPRSIDTFFTHRAVLDFLPGVAPASDLAALIAGEIVFDAVAGVVFLVTLPLVARALVGLHAVIAAAMLGESREVKLRREATAAESSREAAVLAEDRSLRQLERDIHDGPQQGLLRIQYDLASAERALPHDDEDARMLVAGALQQSKDTLDELRKLSQGLAPPLLQDRGLVAAVASLAARSSVPVTATFGIDEKTDNLVEVERSAYFIIAELLANVTKHASAATAAVALSTIRNRSSDQTLQIVVSDDGVGGARAVPEHGLDGLGERIAGLRGSLDIDSPVGGPSTITVRIPLSSPSGRTQ